MDQELGAITYLPLAAIAAGVLLLWLAARGRREVDAGLSPWIFIVRLIGVVLTFGGVLVVVTVMTHALAVFFLVAILAMLAASLHRFYDAERRTMLWIIAAAAERGIPLHQAVRAYAGERNDRVGAQAARLSDYLEAGVPLGLSLQRAGIRVSPAIRLAADLGQHTGALGPALRRATSPGDALDGPLETLVQRLFYVGFLIICILIILTFVIIKIIPVFAHMFEDWNSELPDSTRQLVWAADLAATHWYLLLPLIALAAGILILAGAHYVGFSVRELPLLRRFWWRADCALILHWLATAVRQQRPLPETIRLLAGYFPQPAIRRGLEKAAKRIDRGAEWSASLHQSGLIRRSDSALFQAAERVGNLPWALDEMADSSLCRLAYRCQNYMDVAFPAVLIAVGCGVLFIALGMLMPLFTLISSLA